MGSRGDPRPPRPVLYESYDDAQGVTHGVAHGVTPYGVVQRAHWGAAQGVAHGVVQRAHWGAAQGVAQTAHCGIAHWGAAHGQGSVIAAWGATHGQVGVTAQ